MQTEHLTPVHVDGIPDGQAFQRPVYTIAKRECGGDYVARVPQPADVQYVHSPDKKTLKKLYTLATKK
jgi:hypothetical protein